MIEEERYLLDNFEEKLRKLLFLYEEKSKNNEELKHVISLKDAEIEVLKQKNKNLEQECADLKNATAISLNGGDVKQTKQRLSEMVREVDRCISLLKNQ